MGSEMCIRDRPAKPEEPAETVDIDAKFDGNWKRFLESNLVAEVCLLYTSDAADERSSVDLGGRRIIKKKNRANHRRSRTRTHEKHGEGH